MPRARSTKECGYTGDHVRARRAWLERLNLAGALPCAEPIHKRGCPGVILAGMRFDLAHDRTTGGYRGIAWPPCNRAEGARYGNRRRGMLRAVASGDLTRVFGPLSS